MFRVNDSSKGGLVCDFCQTYYPDKRCLIIHQYIHVDQDIDALFSVSGLSEKSNILPVASRQLSPGISGLRCITNNVSIKERSGRRMSEAVDELLYLCQKYPLKASHSHLDEKYSELSNSQDKSEKSSVSTPISVNLDVMQVRNMDNCLSSDRSLQNEIGSVYKQVIMSVSTPFTVHLNVMQVGNSENYHSSDLSIQKEIGSDDSQTIISAKSFNGGHEYEEADTMDSGTIIHRKKSLSVDSNSDSAYGSSISDGQSSSTDSSPLKSSSDSDSNSSDSIADFEWKSKNTIRILSFTPTSVPQSVNGFDSNRSDWDSNRRRQGPRGLKYKSCNKNLRVLVQNKPEISSKLKVDESFCYDSQKLVGKVRPISRLRN